MREWIHTNWYPGGVGPCFKENNEPPLGCADHSRWEGFANVTMDKIFLTSELDSYLADPEYGCTAAKPELVLGIHFHSVPGTGALGAPGDWSYAIRMNFTMGRVPPTSMGKVSRLQRGLDTGTADTYMQGGFVATQLLVDRYIIGQRNDTLSTDDILRHNNYDWAALTDAFKDFDAVLERQKLAEPLRYAPSRLEISPLPIDGFDMDIFYQLVKDIVPMYFILTFLYTQKKVINELIAEKESRVRESLRMLGMGNAALFGKSHDYCWHLGCILPKSASNNRANRKRDDSGPRPERPEAPEVLHPLVRRRYHRRRLCSLAQEDPSAQIRHGGDRRRSLRCHKVRRSRRRQSRRRACAATARPWVSFVL